MSGRREELAANLARVHERVARACAAAGRSVDDVTVVVVTKTFPASDVALLADLGVRDVGENRDQEAAAKVAETAALLGDAPRPRWHFVGRLQSRKARSVASYASAVHSIDRVELVDKLAGAVASVERAPLDAFVQVSLDADPARGGAVPEAVGDIAGAIASRAELTLRGVMTVLPLGTDPDAGFARLAEISRDVCREYPQADAISAGMSSDLEAAVRHGSTHVRVGTALLGRREQVFG